MFSFNDNSMIAVFGLVWSALLYGIRGGRQCSLDILSDGRSHSPRENAQGSGPQAVGACAATGNPIMSEA